ncbi:MAG: DUF551 domain-containing protein [Negativicutes bacterium]
MATISGNLGIITPSPDGGYAGHIPEVPGCITQGETVEECRAMLKDALRAWVEVATNPWIRPEESLPKNGERVLICYKGKVYDNTTFYADDLFRDDYDGSCVFANDITHWMPLPEPPKECTP